MLPNYLLLSTQEYISCQRKISLLTVVTFIMENKIVEAINYIKKISKMKLSVDRLLAHSNNTTANNWDIEFVEETLYGLCTKFVIDKYFKIP